MNNYTVRVKIPEIEITYEAETEEQALELLHQDMHEFDNLIGASFDYEYDVEEG